jgi:amino acid efflux transporter
VLAVALTMGTMNVYTGASAKLAAALAAERALPSWLAGDAQRSIPRRPLVVLAATGACFLLLLAAGISSTADLIRATSACFIAVYVLALSSAARMLTGSRRGAALVALALVSVVAVFSAKFLLVPALAALIAVAARSSASQRAGRLRHEPAAH